MNVLLEWLGSGGKPVPKEQAEKRSVYCLTCPKNVAPLWWEKMTKDPIAQAMKTQLELKHSMDMSVSNEDKLGICRVCGCCLPLKVFVSLKHIQEHTPDDVMKSFPAWCWIKLELSEQPKNL